MPLVPTGVAKRAPKDPTDRRGRQGAAMVGAGTTIGGAGFLAGGIPGAPEPDARKTWELRGSTKKQRKLVASGHNNPDLRPGMSKSPFSLTNIGHNAKTVATLPRAGVFGYRSNTHSHFTGGTQNQINTGRDEKGKRLSASDKGRLQGKVEAEHKILRGMRNARRISYAAALGGTALAAAGAKRQDTRPVKKRDNRSGGAAVLGATAGGYAGLRYGGDVGRKLVDRRITREYLAAGGKPTTKGQMLVGGDTFVRRAAGVTRGVKGGVLLGTAAGGAGAYKAVKKRDGQRSDRLSTGAVAGGLTTAGIGEVGRRVSGRYDRKFSNAARNNVLRAQKLAPEYGGIKVKPAEGNAHFGIVTRAEKVTRYPEKSDGELRSAGAHNRVPAKHRTQVAHFRGSAAQERHFAEVFQNVTRGFKMVRAPGLAIAGAGGAGLAASRSARKDRERRATRVRKGQFGYERTRASTPRLVEAAAGTALLGWGGSRLGIVRGTLKAGSKASGNLGIASRRAEKVRDTVEDVTGRGAAMIGSQLNTGFRLRPVEGTVGGALLVNHAMPVRRKQFTPVHAPLQQGGY